MSGERYGRDVNRAAASVAEALRKLPPFQKTRPLLVAAVGGGGKTGTLFALAERAAAEGKKAALTTTTHIRDPKTEGGRRFAALLLDADLASAPAVRTWSGSLPSAAAGTGPYVLASGHAAVGLLAGVHPGQAARLKTFFDETYVEADGSRELPIKAPASHEPVVPEGTDIVIGVIGLDCLGVPLDESIAHRVELLSPLVGCARGQPLEPVHLRLLAEHPSGLFKGAPPGAYRLLLLNKADLLPGDASGDASGRILAFFKETAGAHAVAVASLRTGIIRIAET